MRNSTGPSNSLNCSSIFPISKAEWAMALDNFDNMQMFAAISPFVWCLYLTALNAPRPIGNILNFYKDDIPGITLIFVIVQVVFTDLSKEDVNGSEGRVWLVCNVIGQYGYIMRISINLFL